MLFHKSIFFALYSCLLFFSCRKATVSPCNEDTSLYSSADFFIGTAINVDELVFNPRYREIAVKQFNSITAENIFKSAYLHPKPSRFFWADADSLVAFCTTTQKRLHGHTLIWHQQLPEWINTFHGNKSEWEQLFKTHIQTIVSHFKGKVAAWDVVNEAFNEDGTLRNSIWRQHLGDGYIEKAFIYAQEADSLALLFYNDYNLESNPTKRHSVLSLLNAMRARGVKVDGVGLQMHISIMYPDVQAIVEAMDEVVRADFVMHLSEIDISVNPFGKSIELTPDLMKRQADLLGSLVLAYKKVPKRLKYGMTFWGISDQNSWIRTTFNRIDYPLLYDDGYLPKPCFCTLKNTL